MNRFLTKQGGVAKILTFICGRCLGSSLFRTLAVLTLDFCGTSHSLQATVAVLQQLYHSCTSQFLLSSLLLIIQPLGVGGGKYSATLTYL